MSWIVAGEALVDLVPDVDGRLHPTLGGSPYNVAVGLGRLGVPTSFLGPLSRDPFGRQLAARMTDAGVDLRLCPQVDAPTTLALVHLDAAKQASYRFYLEGTSALQLTAATLPTLPRGTGLHVSFGAVGARTEPTGPALAMLLRAGTDGLVSLDPNLRPVAVADDPDSYLAALTPLVAAADVVKVSDEDLAALGDATTIAGRWATAGPSLVVVTRGSAGATAHRAAGTVTVPGHDVQVVDTVGAGDAFTAGLLAGLHEARIGSRAALEACDDRTLRTVLTAASQVAAATCQRAGADPPWRDALGGVWRR